MPINLEDLRPAEATLLINGKLYLVKPFTLRARVWAMAEFATDEQHNGLDVLSEKLKKCDFITAARVLYELLADKTDFKTEAEFVIALSEQTGARAHEKAFRCLTKIFGLSEPQIKQAAEEEEKKKNLTELKK